MSKTEATASVAVTRALVDMRAGIDNAISAAFRLKGYGSPADEAFARQMDDELHQLWTKVYHHQALYDPVIAQVIAKMRIGASNGRASSC